MNRFTYVHLETFLMWGKSQLVTNIITGLSLFSSQRRNVIFTKFTLSSARVLKIIAFFFLEINLKRRFSRPLFIENIFIFHS